MKQYKINQESRHLWNFGGSFPSLNPPKKAVMEEFCLPLHARRYQLWKFSSRDLCTESVTKRNSLLISAVYNYPSV